MHSEKQRADHTRVETAGELFAGGSSLELIRDPKVGNLNLLLTVDRTSTVGYEVNFGGRTYRPINFDARILQAVTFPQELVDYVSTAELFSGICGVFKRCGFPVQVSQIGTFHVISAWFPDCVPDAPCLLVSGPQAEARLFFQVLACLVRRPLQLADINRNDLSLLMRLQPTLLIPQALLSVSRLRLLLASSNPDSFVTSREGLARFYTAKAVYVGKHPEEDALGEAKLRIHLSPLRGNLPILEMKTQLSIADEFQPKLLSYRTRNFEKVRESNFDFPWLTSEPRILARILGACIVDAPDIQVSLSSFFQCKQSSLRENIWLDSRCVAIEAGLAFCHRLQEERLVFVGEFTESVNIILKGRGHSEFLGPKEIGLILRSVGFLPKRSAKGYSLRLTDKIRRQFHQLAFEHDVAALLDEKIRCPHCREIFKNDASEDLPAHDKGETPGA